MSRRRRGGSGGGGQPMSFEEYMESRGGSSGGGASAGEDQVGADFTLSNPQPRSGLRSPDAIDRPGRNVLTITTNVGVQSMPPEEMAMLQQYLKAAGLTPDGFQVSGTLDPDTQKALLELKEVSKTTGTSDMETLRTRIEVAAQAELSGGSGPGGLGATGPKTTTQTTITEPVFTDPITARATVREAMQARLGRMPTADEYDQFHSLLTSKEGGQDVTTTTHRTGRSGNTTSRVSRSDDTTDPSAQDVAEEMTRKGKLGREANTVQAASYFDVIARRVGG